LAHVSTMLALAVALTFVSPIGTIIATAVSFWIATGTISNSSRYKNRNEAWRVKYADDDYLTTLRASYERLSKSHRNQIKPEKNPLFLALEPQKNKFVSDVRYYNLPTPTEFLSDYDALIKSGLHNPEAIQKFLHLLSVKYLADVYFVSSYLQEDLVFIHNTVSHMLQVESNEVDINDTPEASIREYVLYEQIWDFKPRLDISLQRGLIYYGAFQARDFKHSHLVTIMHFWWVKLWELFFGRSRKNHCLTLPKSVHEVEASSKVVIKPIAVESEELLDQMKDAYNAAPTPLLARAIIDVRMMYLATTESFFTSFVVISGYISLVTGIVFTVGNIGLANNPADTWAQDLSLAGTYSLGIASPIPSFVSFLLITRMLKHQWFCARAISSKLSATTDATAIQHLSHIHHIAKLQIWANRMRWFATGGSTIALPWLLAARTGYYDDSTTPEYLAVAAVCLNGLSVLFLYIVEYTSLYNLDPKLGEYISVAFDSELQEMKQRLTLHDKTKPTPVNERIAYEYVARQFLHRYRFDTILLINRFGSILQYIQSGLQRSFYFVPGAESGGKGNEFEVNPVHQ